MLNSPVPDRWESSSPNQHGAAANWHPQHPSAGSRGCRAGARHPQPPGSQAQQGHAGEAHTAAACTKNVLQGCQVHAMLTASPSTTPVPPPPVSTLLPGEKGCKGGGAQWLEKQKGNEVLHFFCYGFEGNLGPTSCFLELTVLKSSICLVKCALKYSGHSKNVNSVTGKKAHRKHVYQHQKHLQSQVTSSFNPRYIILVVSSLS